MSTFKLNNAFKQAIKAQDPHPVMLYVITQQMDNCNSSNAFGGLVANPLINYIKHHINDNSSRSRFDDSLTVSDLEEFSSRLMNDLFHHNVEHIFADVAVDDLSNFAASGNELYLRSDSMPSILIHQIMNNPLPVSCSWMENIEWTSDISVSINHMKTTTTTASINGIYTLTILALVVEIQEYLQSLDDNYVKKWVIANTDTSKIDTGVTETRPPEGSWEQVFQEVDQANAKKAIDSEDNEGAIKGSQSKKSILDIAPMAFTRIVENNSALSSSDLNEVISEHYAEVLLKLEGIAPTKEEISQQLAGLLNIPKFELGEFEWPFTINFNLDKPSKSNLEIIKTKEDNHSFIDYVGLNNLKRVVRHSENNPEWLGSRLIEFLKHGKNGDTLSLVEFMGHRNNSVSCIGLNKAGRFIMSLFVLSALSH